MTANTVGFVYYVGADQGLPERTATDFLEPGTGEYWVATAGAMSRFNPDGRRGLFETHRLPQRGDEFTLIQIAEGRDGRIWCQTLHDLLCFDRRHN